jgi:hypothetical protein
LSSMTRKDSRLKSIRIMALGPLATPDTSWPLS